MGGCNQETPAEEIIIERLHATADGPSSRRYRKGRLLGKGGFARVYELTDIESGDVFAGKIVQKSSLSKARAKAKLMTEIRIHKALDHPNIVRFHRYFEDATAVYLLLELCENQTLMELLKGKRRLQESEVVMYIKQVIGGCKYMRDQKVIHRDLKLGNLFLNRSGTVKIGDFGLAAQLENETDRKTTICGTPNYIAPEVLSSKQGQRGHSFEADVWSIGVVIYTLIVGRPPFETADVKSTYQRIQACDFDFPLDRVAVSEDAQNIIRQTLLVDPTQRPTLSQMLQHPFFSRERSCGAARDESRVSGAVSSKRPLANPDPVSRLDVKRGSRDSEKCDSKSARLAWGGQGGFKKVGGPQESLPRQFESMQLGGEAGELESGPRMVSRNSAELIAMLEGPWVVKWVDYSHKYGMGYMLSDSSAGACFNDTTKIVMATNGTTAEYVGRKRERPDDQKVQWFETASYPEELHKKVTLIKHFAAYLNEHQGEGALEPVDGAVSATRQMVYVKKWVRTKHAVVFRMSNRTYQVNFFDHSMIVLSGTGSRVAYFAKDQQDCETHTLLNLERDGSAGLLKRFRYAKQVIVQLASNQPGEVKVVEPTKLIAGQENCPVVAAAANFAVSEPGISVVA